MVVIFRGFLRLLKNSSIQVSFEFKHDAHMEASIGQARIRDVTSCFTIRSRRQALNSLGRADLESIRGSEEGNLSPSSSSTFHHRQFYDAHRRA